MISIETLDVTRIEPKLKHPTIFRHFDELEPGDCFVIHNDHDPKPLYYQLLGERGDIFTWEYLEQGPEWWRVKITRKGPGKNSAAGGQNDPGAGMNTQTVGAIAASDYRKAEAFKKMGIDFCCGGSKTLIEASQDAGISEQQLAAALEEKDREASAPSGNFNKWELDFLVDFIVNTHHRYVKDNAEVIIGLAKTVAGHHGENHSELAELAVQVNRFVKEMLAHLVKEEGLVFPYIKQLAASARSRQIDPNMPAGFIANAVNMMQAEHVMSGDDLKLFRKITGDYSLPADACNSNMYLFEKLKEFEEDLLMHIHLENNILFPRAVKMEAGLKKESDVY